MTQPTFQELLTSQERVVDPLDRAYARALVAELLRDMPTFFANPPAKTTEAVCNEIRRRAGIVEGEG